MDVVSLCTSLKKVVGKEVETWKCFFAWDVVLRVVKVFGVGVRVEVGLDLDFVPVE
jgi:hypothetical protein